MEEINNHNLNFRSGMLQSWNKFCFTTGYIEVSVSMPGRPEAPGLWPAAWTMGNLVSFFFSSLKLTFVRITVSMLPFAGSCRVWSDDRRNVALQLRLVRYWDLSKPDRPQWKPYQRKDRWYWWLTSELPSGTTSLRLHMSWIRPSWPFCEQRSRCPRN